MKKNQLLIFLFVLAIAGACTTTQPQNIPTGNPEQLVNQLDADLAAAKSNQVDVLAPGLYNGAQSSFLKAKQALTQGAKLSDISAYVAQGSAQLEKAKTIAQVSRTILTQTNEARGNALNVGADRLGEPYMEVEKQYLSLTKAIEEDNLSYAQKHAGRVQTAFRELEIMAIKNNALGNARTVIAGAEKTKVHKIAPTAYNDALQALKAADVFIEQNPYAAEAISEKAAHAEFMMRRMLIISEGAKKFEKMTPEASALYVETLLASLGKALKTADLRDMEVGDQLSTLTRGLETMERKNQSLENENHNYQTLIASMEQRISGLQGYSREQEEAKQKLAAEREFNERFNTVQGYFGSDEAEVYKQGSRLVIRLRGIQFPVGQATLTPENYTLLSKVQKAIQSFDQPSVTIEGHTDSTGSAQANQELSQKRAEAVKTYLVANNTLPENRIRATGYGPDRPLAPNTTAEGRAINRRIDVLITASQLP